MSLKRVKSVLEQNDGNFDLGQFALDWIEIELDRIEETEEFSDGQVYVGALHYRIGTLLAVMKDDAPCRAFFEGLEVHTDTSLSDAEHNTKIIKLWSKFPPKVSPINRGGGR